MSSNDISKGLDNLKIIATQLNDIIDMSNSRNFSNINRVTDIMHEACNNLLDIFEKEFMNLIESEVMEDDGK